MVFEYKYYEFNNLSNSFEISPKDSLAFPKSRNSSPSIMLFSIKILKSFIFDSGVTSASPPPASAGGGVSPPPNSPPAGSGSPDGSPPPPNDGSGLSVSVPAPCVVVVPVVVP